jgi:preprotein translocase subunit YajC
MLNHFDREKDFPVKQNLLEIEKNIKMRPETDRIMWFSMWVILSVVSFGIAWFPMIYYLIKRRNAHFRRQKKLQTIILSKLKKAPSSGKSKFTAEKMENLVPSRNVWGWTVLSLLVIPAFYVFYFLKSDLAKHEEQEHDFLVEVIGLAKDSEVPLNIHGFTATRSFTSGKYLILSAVTLGLAATYWLYRIFNDYNNHFKMQWKIEDELLVFLKTVDKRTS